MKPSLAASYSQAARDGNVLGVEARDHAGLSGWGHLLCSVQSMSVVGLGLHRAAKASAARSSARVLYSMALDPLLPLGEMVGQFTVVLRG